MQFNIHLTKTTNFFLFLVNLSQWEPWTRKEYNEVWLELTGELTPGEEQLLAQFNQVLEQTFNSEQEPFLYTLFFNPNQKPPWKKIKKELTLEHYRVVQQTFTKFRKRFDKIWKDLPTEEAEQSYQQHLKQFAHTEELLKTLAEFYSGTVDNKIINIFLFLLPSQISSMGGKREPSNQAIIVEGSLPQLLSPKSIEIIFHELIHLHFEKFKLQKLLDQHFKNPQQKHQIKEIIAGALLPNGYLSQKYFQQSSLTHHASQKLIPIVKKYLQNNKEIDMNLIEEVAKLLSSSDLKKK